MRRNREKTHFPSRWFTFSIETSCRYPKTVVGCILTITLVSVCFIPRIRPQLSGHALIPENHPGILSAEEAGRRFDARESILVGLSHEESIYTIEALTALRDLGEAIAAIDGVLPETIASLATIPRYMLEDDHLDLRPLLWRGDPIDEAMVARVREESRYLDLEDGLLVSSDGMEAAIYAEVDPEADPYAIQNALEELAARPLHPSLEVRVSGSILAQAVLGGAVARDLAVLVPFTLALLAGMLIFYYHHGLMALVTLTEIGITLLWTLGLMGLTGTSVFITTLVLPIMLISIGVSDDIYALNAALTKTGPCDSETFRARLTAGFTSVVTPILMTATTTVIGLLSLVLTRLESFRVFGLFSAISIVFSTLFTFTLLPALLVLFRDRLANWKPHLHRSLTAVMIRAVRGFRGRRLGGLAWAGATALILGAMGSRLIRVDDSWLANLPPDSDLVIDSRRLDETMAGTTRLELVLDSGRRDGFLEPANITLLGRLEDTLAQLPNVGDVRGPFDAIARLQAALEPMPYREFRAGLEDDTLDHARIYQSLLLLSSLKNTSFRVGLDPEYRRARTTISIRDADYRVIDDILQEAERVLSSHEGAIPELTSFGDGWISYLTVRILVEDQVTSLMWAFLADFVFLLLVWRSAKWALVVLLPVVTSILAVFTILALSGTALGIANSMFAAIAIGIGVDFSIHLVAEFRRARLSGLEPQQAVARSIRKTGPAIGTSAIAISGGFSVLLLSEVHPNASLGLLIGLTLISAAGTTLLMAPLLAVWSRKSAPETARVRPRP